MAEREGGSNGVAVDCEMSDAGGDSVVVSSARRRWKRDDAKPQGSRSVIYAHTSGIERTRAINTGSSFVQE
jgi:hypothetical protein